MKIIITGVTRGLGRALVHEFLESGHEVAGCGRDAERMASLSREYPQGRFARVDITREIEVADWAEKVLQQVGPPDILINNAAMINRSAPLWEISPEEFDDILRINLGGVHRVIRHFLPAMMQAGSGMIINFSSGWGRSTSPDVAPYCSTKWGIEGLTKALAQELPSGMGAVPLNPGIIETEMLRSAFGNEAASFQSPETWAKKAAPFILKLSPEDSGKSCSIP